MAAFTFTSLAALVLDQNDVDLTPSERFVAVFLAYRGWSHGECWPGYADMRRGTGLARSSLQLAIEGLFRKGWVDRIDRGPGKARGYRIAFRECTDSRYTASQYTDSRHSGIPTQDEQTPPRRASQRGTTKENDEKHKSPSDSATRKRITLHQELGTLFAELAEDEVGRSIAFVGRLLKMQGEHAVRAAITCLSARQEGRDPCRDADHCRRYVSAMATAHRERQARQQGLSRPSSRDDALAEHERVRAAREARRASREKEAAR